MQEKIVKYFEKEDVEFFTKKTDLTWEEGAKKYPRLTKGWFELSRLDQSVRQEFLRDYWVNALIYSPQLFAFVDRFFSRVEGTEIVATKSGVFLVYGLKDALFMGGPPLTDSEIEGFASQVEFPLPQDFRQFYRIHNGFFKGGDTGIFSSGVLVEEYQRFTTLNAPLKIGHQTFSTASLLPFYRSFGLDVYQCFYKDWYPDGGVGNVHCRLAEGEVYDYRREGSLAFPSFTEWLMFYMEEIAAE